MSSPTLASPSHASSCCSSNFSMPGYYTKICNCTPFFDCLIVCCRSFNRCLQCGRDDCTFPQDCTSPQAMPWNMKMVTSSHLEPLGHAPVRPVYTGNELLWCNHVPKNGMQRSKHMANLSTLPKDMVSFVLAIYSQIGHRHRHRHRHTEVFLVRFYSPFTVVILIQ